jgi:cysteinyl-tRNA synthetase
VQKATLGWLDEVLGLGLDAWGPAACSVPAAVQQLVDARQLARAEKRWADADALREEIETAGFSVRDTAAGPVAAPAGWPYVRARTETSALACLID